MSDHMITYYDSYDEDARLQSNNARRIEFLTTTRILGEHLPPSGKILDTACGTGIYALDLAEKGYDVTAYDFTPSLIEILNGKLEKTNLKMETGVGDVRDLSRFGDETFDVVLLMGPLYHLPEAADREKSVTECRRVLKPGGILAAAYIGRFYVFPWCSFQNRFLLTEDFARRILADGAFRHDDPDCFWTDNYFYKPKEIEDFMAGMGFEFLDHAGVDGLAPNFGKQAVDSYTEEEFRAYCEYHYLTCREPSLLGVSNHGLYLGRKPTKTL